MDNNTTVKKQSIYESIENNGIPTFKFKSWNDFFHYINNNMGKYDAEFIWRGQADSKWEIVSSLKRQKIIDYHHLLNFRNAIAHLTTTKFKIAHGEENAENERMKLWGLGQHFGLMTPLIDWTQFPFVAVFFAFREEMNKISPQEYRAIYALNVDRANSANYDIIHDGEMGMDCFINSIRNPPYSDKFIDNLILQFDKNFSDSQKDQLRKTKCFPESVIKRLIAWQQHSLEERTLKFFTPESDENYRIHNQGGLFCYLPEDVKSVEEWVRRHIKKLVHKDILHKFLVPNSDRKEILKSLNKMRINYLSLFPDLEGAAKYCNMAIRERDLTLGSIRPY